MHVSWGTQVAALVKLRALVAFRKKKQLAALLLAPAVVVLIIVAYQGLADYVLEQSIPEQPVVPVPKLQAPRSGQPWSSRSATPGTVLYAPTGAAQVDATMQRLATAQGLAWGHDVGGIPGLAAPTEPPAFPEGWGNATQFLPGQCTPCSLPAIEAGNLDCLPCQLLEANFTLTQWMMQHPNSTSAVLLFLGPYLPSPSDEGTADSYIMYYNYSATQYPFFAQPPALPLKLALDEAIHAGGNTTHASVAGLTLRVQTQAFPQPLSRLRGYDVAAAQGAVYFFIPAAQLFFVALTSIVEEKAAEQRLALGVLGVGSAYWASWAVFGLAAAAASASVLYAAGAIAQFKYFVNSAVGVTWLLQFLLGLAMIGMAAAVSPWLSSPRTAQLVGYTVVLLGFVFAVILSSGYAALVDLLWSDTLPAWVAPVRWALCCYPGFLYSLLFYDITLKAGNIVHEQKGIVTFGPGFEWGDLLQPLHRVVFGLQATVPAPIVHVAWLTGLALAFAGLTLLAEACMPEGTGRPHGWCARQQPGMLCDVQRSPLLSCCRRASRHRRPSHARSLNQSSAAIPLLERRQQDLDAHSAAADVRAEAELVRAVQWPAKPGQDGRAQDEQGHSARVALTVDDVHVQYTRRCSCKRERVRAVRGVSFALRQGEVAVLVGENGSGKSTLFKSILGVQPIFQGAVTVKGSTLDSSTARQAQQRVGVCLQSSILWPELTCSEHARLWAALRGFASTEADQAVARTLGEVNLQDVRDVPSAHLSGGMARRLVLGLACMSPYVDVLLLDEPLAGLDILHKRQLWRMIQGLAESRAVIVTTHDMNQAEALADRVLVLQQGRLQTLGTPPELKARHSGGFRLQVTLRSGAHGRLPAPLQQQVDATVGSHSTVQRTDAGVVAIAIAPHADNAERLPELLCWLSAATADPESGVSDWDLSQGSLEDVFLAVTAQGYSAHEVTPSEPGPGLAAAPAEPKLLAASPAVDTPGSYASAGALATMLDFRRVPVQYSWWRSMRAVLLKDVALLAAAPGMLACQLLAPLAVLATLALLTAVARTQLEDMTESVAPSVLVPLHLDTAHALASYGLHSLLGRQPWQHHLPSRSAPTCYEWMFVAVDPRAGRGAAALASATGWRSPSGQGAGMLNATQHRQCQLRNGSTITVPFYAHTASLAAAQASIYTTMNSLARIPEAELQWSPPCEPGVPCPAYELPDAVLGVHALNTTPSHALADVTIAVNDADVLGYHRPNNFTRIDLRAAPAWVQDRAVTVTPAQLTLLDDVVTAVRKMSGSSLPASVRLVGTMPETVSQDLGNLLQVFASFLIPLALSLQLPLFVYVAALEREAGLTEHVAVSGLPLTARVAASCILNYAVYIAVVGIMWGLGVALGFELFQHAPADVLLAIFSTWGIAMLGLSQVLAACVSQRATAAVVGYTIALLGTVCSAVISNGIYGDIPPFSAHKPMPQVLQLIPQVAFTRAVYLVNFACLLLKQCPTSAEIFQASPASEVMVAVLAMAGVGLLLAVSGLWLDAVMPRERSVPAHVLWCCPVRVQVRWDAWVQQVRHAWAAALLRCKHGNQALAGQSSAPLLDDEPSGGAELAPLARKIRAEALERATQELHVPHPGMPMPDLYPHAETDIPESTIERCRHELSLALGATSPIPMQPTRLAEYGAAVAYAQAEDAGVYQHRRTVAAAAQPAELRIEHVRLTYPAEARDTGGRCTATTPARFVAVSDLSLEVRRGKALALVAANGGGKSSTIGVITGAVRGDAGSSVSVAGQPGGPHQSIAARLRVGLCPQANLLWDELSVAATLLFYVRMKGVSREQEQQVVAQLSQAVNLHSVMSRTAGALSGGMKRRLMLATALVAQDGVLLVDEGGAAVDPAGRRNLWAIINAVKQAGQRAVVLASHHHDEIRALADDVLMIAHGRAHVFGTRAQLKSKYGRGVHLRVAFPPTALASERAERWIREAFSGASMDAKYIGSSTWILPAHAQVAAVVRTMLQQAESAGISSWSLGDVSLEDVFARVAAAFPAFV